MSNNYSLRLGNRVIIPLVLFALVSVSSVALGLGWMQQNVEPQRQAQDLPAVAPSQEPRALNADLMEQLINDERVKLGLATLASSETLRASACAKLDHMVKYDYWSHTAPDGTEPWHFFDVVGYSYTKAGENLAYGQRTEAAVVSGWMNSQTHRENIVGEFAESGLCSRLEMYQGWTQTITVHHFGTRQ
jgi:uncharacterized protein YkwD